MESLEIAEVYEENHGKKKKEIVNGIVWAGGQPNKLRIPTEDEIVSNIIQVSKIDMEAAAYLSLLYLTGSRVEEIAPYHYTGKEYREGNLMNIRKHGIRVQDIVPEEDRAGMQWIWIVTRVSKTFKAQKDMSIEEREKKLTKEVYKKQRFPYQKEHPIFPLLKVIERYLERFEGDESKKVIVDVCSRTIRAYCRKYLKLHPHLLRHWRCKILVRDYGFTPQDLQKFLGWASPAMPMFYSESEQELIDKKMLMMDY